jgi:hypothetical protein
MRIDSPGNLFLGVTPSAWGSGVKVAQVSFGALVSSATNNTLITSNCYYNGSQWVYLASSSASIYTQNSGLHSWRTAPSGTAGNNITFSTLMLLDASGNLGVGTTSPAYRVQINRTEPDALGIFRALDVGAVGAAGTYIDLGALSGSTATAGARIVGVLNNPATSGYITFNTLNSSTMGERMIITAAGNVGIANTAPAVRLQIGGLTPTSTSSPETISLGGTFSSTAGGNPKLRVWTDGTNSIGLGVSSDQFDFIATGSYSHVFYQNGSERMRINPSGHLVPGANATYNLGSTSLRWSTVYTSDLDLSNGIGDWTIVEGEDDLFIYNNKRGKVYKFKLEEVDPATAVPKKENL